MKNSVPTLLRYYHVWCSLVFVFCAGACLGAVPNPEPAEFLQVFVSALNARDLATVKLLLSDDPKTSWVNVEPRVGRDVVFKIVEHWLTSKDANHWRIAEIQDIRISEDLAVIVASMGHDGQYGDVDIRLQGTWTLILERIDRRWHLLHLHEGMLPPQEPKK